MKKQLCFVLMMLLCSSLLTGNSWGDQITTYNGKMNLLMQNYLSIQQALANDSLEGVSENAHSLVRLTHDIQLLVANKLPPKAKECLELIKRKARGLTNKDIFVVRQYFQSLSRLYVEYLETVGLPDSLKDMKAFVFYCPQTNSRWIQTNKNMANPFYGKIMLKTGQFQGKLQSKATAAFNGF